MKLATKFFLSVLGAFVLVVAWLAWDSQRELTGLSDINSRDPDGWYVLAELLRSEGYQVEQSNNVPAPAEDTLLVVTSPWLEGVAAYAEHPNRLLHMPPGAKFVRTKRESRDQIYDPYEESDYQRVEVRTVTNADMEGVTFEISGVAPINYYGPEYQYYIPYARDWSSGFQADSLEIAYRTYANWIEYTLIRDTTFTQNRWIAKNDNAALALTVFRSNIEPGGRIIFVETAPAGLFAVLGPWSRATKILFFVFMGVYLVGSRRFAKAYPREPKVQSSKDLIYAMAAMLKQADHAGFALQRVLDYDLAELRRQLRLPSHVPEEAVLKELPQELKHGFIQARGSSAEKNPSRVLRILKEWRKLLGQFQTGVR